MKKIIATAVGVLAAIFAFFSIMPARPGFSAAVTVHATLPWLAGMARFIVGSTIDVQSVSSWNASGALRSSKRLPRGVTVIALDPADASRLGVESEPELHLLYNNLPIGDAERPSLPFNPSILPFLSQRLLIVLCELSPDNYSFYQRRLAEFQSRLESAVLVGRKQIGDISILDLPGAVSPWIRSASEKTARPPEELWDAWSRSTRTPELAEAVKEAESRGWWILLDAWTPVSIQTRSTAAP